MFFVWKVCSINPGAESDQQDFLDSREDVERAVCSGEEHWWLIGVDVEAGEIFDPEWGEWKPFDTWFSLVQGWSRLADLIPGYKILGDIR